MDVNEEDSQYQKFQREKERSEAMARTKVSQPAAFENMDMSDLGLTFWLKLISTVLYIATGLVLIILYATSDTVKDFEFDLWFTSVDAYGPKIESASTYNVTVANAIACLVWAIGGAIELAGWSSFSKRAHQNRTDTVHWVAESVAVPILGVSTMVAFANLELFSVVSYFGLLHISIVLGLVQEMVQKPRKENKEQYSTAALWYSGWVSLFQYVPFIVFLSYIGEPDEMQAVVWVAVSLSVVRSVLLSLVQVSYAMFLNSPSEGVLFNMRAGAVKNYARYQNWNITISSVFNLSVTYLLLAMVYGDNSYVDGASESEVRCPVDNQGLIDNQIGWLSGGAPSGQFAAGTDAWKYSLTAEWVGGNATVLDLECPGAALYSCDFTDTSLIENESPPFFPCVWLNANGTFLTAAQNASAIPWSKIPGITLQDCADWRSGYVYEFRDAYVNKSSSPADKALAKRAPPRRLEILTEEPIDHGIEAAERRLSLEKHLKNLKSIKEKQN